MCIEHPTVRGGQGFLCTSKHKDALYGYTKNTPQSNINNTTLTKYKTQHFLYPLRRQRENFLRNI
jgi:hypothetical protein